jgi:ethanolamine utilization microcompartment shell protein EutL
MALKQDIDTLLAKKMDRKDFLKHIGIAVITATGLGAVVKVLAGDENKAKNSAVGYGGSVYGGTKNT